MNFGSLCDSFSLYGNRKCDERPIILISENVQNNKGTVENFAFKLKAVLRQFNVFVCMSSCPFFLLQVVQVPLFLGQGFTSDHFDKSGYGQQGRLYWYITFIL